MHHCLHIAQNFSSVLNPIHIHYNCFIAFTLKLIKSVISLYSGLAWKYARDVQVIYHLPRPHADLQGKIYFPIQKRTSGKKPIEKHNYSDII